MGNLEITYHRQIYFDINVTEVIILTRIHIRYIIAVVQIYSDY